MAPIVVGLSLMILSVLPSIEGRPKSSGCKSLTPPQQQELWVEYLDDTSNATHHESRYLLASMQSDIWNKLQKSSGEQRQPRAPNTGEAERCMPSDNLSDPIRVRSTCPWYEVENFDMRRFPMIIYEASCSTCNNSKGCRLSDGTTDPNSVCQEMYYNVRVLREADQVSSDGETCVYERGWQRLAVGCTCVHRDETGSSK